MKAAPFHTPWPVTLKLEPPERAEARQAILRAHGDAGRRFAAHERSPKSGRLRLQMRHTGASFEDAAWEMFLAEVDAAHAGQVLDLARWCAGQGLSLDALGNDYARFLAGWLLLAERHGPRPGDPLHVLWAAAPPDEVARVAAPLRVALRDVVAFPRLHKVMHDAGRARRMLQGPLAALDDRALLALSELPAEEIEGVLIETGEGFDAVRARLEAFRDEARRRADALRPTVKTHRDTIDRLFSRLTKTRQFVVEPMHEVLRAAGTRRDPLGLVLAMEEWERMAAAVMLVPSRFAAPVADLPEAPLLRLAVAMSDETWYVALFQILARTGALDGDALRPWVTPLLHDLLNHPSRLGRRPCPQEAQKTRSALAKQIAPYLRDAHHQASRQLLTEEATRGLPPADILLLTAHECAAAVRAEAAEGAGVPPAQAEVVDLLLETILLPHASEILSFLARCSQDATAIGSLDELELIRQLDLAMEAGELPEAPEPSVPEAPAAPAPPVRDWWLTLSPARPAATCHAVAWTPGQDPEADLAAHLQRHRMECSVPSRSILNALDHYLALDPAIQAVLPHEIIEGQSWRKLKRGKTRILVRHDDGRLLFHVYDRKDWVSKGRLR
jgi:hypothetical protein